MEKLLSLKRVALAINILNLVITALNVITGLAISDLPNPTNRYTQFDPQVKFYYGVAVVIALIAISNIVQTFIKLPKSTLMLATNINVVLNHFLCGASVAVLSLSGIFLTFFNEAFPDWSILGE